MARYPQLGAVGEFLSGEGLAQNCLVYAVGGAADWTNLARDIGMTRGGDGSGLSTAASPYGPTLSTSGTLNGFVQFGQNANYAPGTGDYAIAALTNPGSLVNSFTQYTSGGVEILHGSVAGNTSIRVNGVSVSATKGGLNDGDYHMIVYSRHNGVGRFFVDGVLISSQAETTSISGTSPLTVGKRGTTNTYYALPGVAMIGYWDRALSDDEIARLTGDPFQLARPTTAQRLLLRSGSVAGINADASGSLVFTGSGSAAVALAGTSGGSLAFTGVAQAGVAIASDAAGSIAFTGAATASVAATGTVTGTFSLTGVSEGQIALTAHSSGVLDYAGAVTGVIGFVPVTGAASGSLTFAGSATGTVVIASTATGILSFTGEGVGGVSLVGSVAGGLAFTGATTGGVSVVGTAAGPLQLAGAAEGVASSLDLAGAGTFPLSGAATGAVRTHRAPTVSRPTFTPAQRAGQAQPVRPVSVSVPRRAAGASSRPRAVSGGRR